MKWYEDKEYQMKWHGNKEYQKMCKEAEGIRKDHKWRLGDYFLHEGHKPPIVLVVTQEELQYGDMECACCEGKRVWLPSQEDLQEMVCDSDLTDYGKLYQFNRWLVQWNMKEELRRRTINQWWLMFVMHHLYQKKWNPEKKEWEKE